MSFLLPQGDIVVNKSAGDQTDLCLSLVPGGVLRTVFNGNLCHYATQQMSDVTRILQSMEGGHPEAAAELLSLVYGVFPPRKSSLGTMRWTRSRPKTRWPPR